MIRLKFKPVIAVTGHQDGEAVVRCEGIWPNSEEQSTTTLFSIPAFQVLDLQMNRTQYFQWDPLVPWKLNRYLVNWQVHAKKRIA